MDCPVNVMLSVAACGHTASAIAEINTGQTAASAKWRHLNFDLFSICVLRGKAIIASVCGKRWHDSRKVWHGMRHHLQRVVQKGARHVESWGRHVTSFSPWGTKRSMSPAKLGMTRDIFCSMRAK